MQVERRARALVCLLAAASAAACTDTLPTAGGEERFPAGAAPTTVELLVPAGTLVLGSDVYDGFGDPRATRYLLVANDFDGELDAHTLASFRNFPQVITYTSGGTTITDSTFEYVSGELRGVVSAGASAERVTTLRVHTLEQPWDSATVSWTLAEGGAEPVPWRAPGGTSGRLLSEAVWTPGDTVAADTVIWQLDSLAVREMAAEGFPGVLVTSAEPDTRVQLSRLSLRVQVRPASTPDTTISASVPAGPQTFVFDPAPPAPEGVFRVGGITGARTVLRLDLAHEVPACAGGGAECPRVPLRDVVLNQAELVLQPLAVPSGFRPVGVSPLLVRRVVEPELGSLAPLGEALVSDTVSAESFTPGEAAPVRVNITTAVRVVTESDSTSLTVALLGESAAGQFGYQWYAGEPRLRLVYTLPLRPRLP